MHNNNHQPLIMEITILSAEGLKNTSSGLFSYRIRPFITLNTVPTTSYKPIDGDKHGRVYKTRVDDEGGVNPSWGDKFTLQLEPTFFTQRYSSIHLQIYNKHVTVGKSRLGWCQIPASDITQGLPPVGSVRRLSYRVRTRDGSRGEGVINVAVRLESQLPEWPQGYRSSGPYLTCSPAIDIGRTAIGIPVGLLPSLREHHVTGTLPVLSRGRLDVSCGEEK